ncbi:helix-turn-helix transcriptional regulator [Natronolimnohabitans innermongolicus]|uniref:Transcriptional regulator n=1 Tax=Natronolimnohabitans innermongolicus JCM 12255 TaxID=1227499 RepID=L9WL19_9EURY|nr:transcriptional regulator [Natronolimnohabitans innermongolicus]ELY50195.1 transcriptional regulator [Natronolimnohabitans innermongolicus JCM 12255]
MDATPDDIEFLVSSDHRVGVLEALARDPCTRDELRTATGASSPTMGRILSDFQERHWIDRDGQTYRLTGLGEFVASRFEEFKSAMAYQRRLCEIWPWLPHEIDGFSVELFTDVVVSRPGPGYPYKPIERLTDLITTAGTMRGFGMALLKSGNLEPFFDHVLEGLECEYIYPPAVFEDLLSWDEETVMKTARRANYTVLLHDGLPLDDRCGICVFDDRVSICCYDTETGALQLLVDTGSDEMRTWAASYYEQFRDEARPLEGETELLSSESI